MGEWDRRNQELGSLRKALKENPANLELADLYWCALAGIKAKNEADYRCGRDVIEAYREAAMSSSRGTVAFARAYRALFKISGESPRAVYFDQRLIEALTSHLSELSEIDQSNVEWILHSIAKAPRR